MFLFVDLIGKLPPVIARREVNERFGGIISPKTLANLDSQGIGPEGKHRLGNRVFYETSKLLEWLDNRQKGTNGGETS